MGQWPVVQTRRATVDQIWSAMFHLSVSARIYYTRFLFAGSHYTPSPRQRSDMSHVPMITWCCWQHENMKIQSPTQHTGSALKRTSGADQSVYMDQLTEHSSPSKFPDGNLFAAFCWKLRADKCLQILISRRRWSISISHSKIIRKKERIGSIGCFWHVLEWYQSASCVRNWEYNDTP